MKAALTLTEFAVENGWQVLVAPGVDSDGAKFVTIVGREAGGLGSFRVTWHTRETGTYRLFSSIGSATNYNLRQLSLRKIRELVLASKGTQS